VSSLHYVHPEFEKVALELFRYQARQNPVYGEWVTAYPAEWWALLIFAASTVYLFGIVINGHWRWSPVLRVAGAAAHVTTMAAFVRGASGAVYGDFFVLICFVMGVVHAVFLAWNIFDLARAIRGHDG
jgi:hypothetical protein